MLVCKKHVTEALEALDVPHVVKVDNYHSTCSFCKKEANLKIFYSIPFFKTFSKKKQILVGN
ncbi:hypothetical protein J2Y02_003461 [Neobacillus drentensis]|nr:hypothetical protein [Neobacillus drentensis]